MLTYNSGKYYKHTISLSSKRNIKNYFKYKKISETEYTSINKDNNKLCKSKYIYTI